jgi:hypothetical protein
MSAQMFVSKVPRDIRRRAGIALLTLALAAGVAVAGPSSTRPHKSAAFKASGIKAAALAQQYGALLDAEGVPPAQRQQFVNEFGGLAEGVEESAIAVLQEWKDLKARPDSAAAGQVSANVRPRYGPASASDKPSVAGTHLPGGASVSPAKNGADRSAVFAITAIEPRIVDGQPGSWSLVFGTHFDAQSVVLYDGTPVDTGFIAHLDAKHSNVLAFEPPTGTTVGVEHQISVRDKVSGTVTEAFADLIVAPRGYRGLWGYQFANFSTTNIPWQDYVDFFGHNAIYDPYGSVRPTAFWYYLLIYSQEGTSGDCYGMAVSSLRWHNGDIVTQYHPWFWKPGRYHKYTWWYPFRTETQETVEEDQGGQVSKQMAAHFTYYFNNQDAHALWNRIASASKGIVLCMRGTDAAGNAIAHAVVPYGTQVNGDDHQILLYDNNVPYAANELGGPDLSLAHVYWKANRFAYGSYNRAIALTFDEVVEPPMMPAAARGATVYAGADADGTSVFVVSGGAAVRQITDEAGHTFYTSSGEENSDPATRIPMSLRFLPVTGGSARPGDPRIYVFSSSAGKSLTFDLGGTDPKTFAAFMPGAVLRADGAGGGKLQVLNVGQATAALTLQNPSAFQPSRIALASTSERGDRVFALANLRGLSAEPIALTPSADGSSLDVRSAHALQFDLQTSTSASQGRAGATAKGISLKAGQSAQLAPNDWGGLQGGMHLKLLGARSGTVIEERDLTAAVTRLPEPRVSGASPKTPKPKQTGTRSQSSALTP